MKQLKKLHLILNVLSVLYPKTTNTLRLIGIIYVLKKIVGILTTIYKKMLRPKRNLSKRYGPGSWALITGSSEGIGKSMAFEFAKLGFNIVLSARTEAKLETAKKELLAKHGNIQVKTLAVDYSNSMRPTFLRQIMAELNDIDVSILVNNVGVDVLDHYHKLSEDELMRLININCGACSILSHIFIPRLLKRNKRSAIINVASLAGQIPMALHNIYSASKAYVDFLSRSLSYQYNYKIDIISLRPSQVSTPMTFNKQTDIMTILPQDCAKGMLKDLGHQQVTNGHWSHSLQSSLYHALPECFFNYAFLNFVGPDFMKEREKARKKQ